MIFQENRTEEDIQSETITSQHKPKTLPKTDNPFPLLDKFFEYVGRTGNSCETVNYKCITCKMQLKAHYTTTSNLKRHITIRHPDIREAFVDIMTKNKRHRNNSDECPVSPRKRSNVNKSDSGVKQNAANQKIVEFFVTNMINSTVVDSVSFREMVESLNENFPLISPRLLNEIIEEKRITTEYNICRYTNTLNNKINLSEIFFG